jgi:hypothetical protein
MVPDQNSPNLGPIVHNMLTKKTFVQSAERGLGHNDRLGGESTRLLHPPVNNAYNLIQYQFNPEKLLPFSHGHSTKSPLRR